MDSIALEVPVLVGDFLPLPVTYVDLPGFGMMVRPWHGGIGRMMSQMNLYVGDCQVTLGQKMTAMKKFDTSASEVSFRYVCQRGKV